MSTMTGRTLKVSSARRKSISSMMKIISARVKISRAMASKAQVRKSRRISTSLMARVMTRPTE